VKQVTEKVVAEADTEYRMAGVRWYAGGVFHRETVRGDGMSARYVTPLKPGALIYNRLFAWKESFAYVTTEHEGLFVSNEFPQFLPDTSQVLPEFLYLYCTIPSTTKLVNAASAGSAAVSRNRFKESEFTSFELRLPPLATQRSIVAHWQATQDKNAAAFKATDDHERSMNLKFLDALGLSNHIQGITQRAFAQRWSEIERWSLGYIRQTSGNLDPEGGRYPVARLGDVVADLSNGWSPQCLTRPAEDDEWGVLKLGAVSFGSFNEQENKALPPSLKPEPALEIKVGDVLISRANIPRLVGACAHVTATRPKLLLCDKIFRVVPKANPAITPEYIAEVMKLPHLRRQIESSVTGSSPTMQNITKPALLALRIPLPPLNIQKQLVSEVTAARAHIAAERAAAAKLAADTAREVEQMILGQIPVSASKTIKKKSS
jgi:type I restriction enzyme S subunit